MTQPGWYEVEGEDGTQRYWDGQAWTDQRRPAGDAPPPPGGGDQSRPWWRRKRVLIPAGLVVLAIAGAGGAGDDGGDEPTSAAVEEAVESQAGDDGADEPVAPEEPDGDAPASTGIGQPARDGKFEFVVEAVECGVDEVGDEFFGESAQGQFCLVTVTVENIGDEAQSLFAANQYLYDDQGREFSASSSATFANDPEGQGFFTEINPGNSVTGEIVFDVPADATLVRVELHDSAFSGGVEVVLG